MTEYNVIGKTKNDTWRLGQVKAKDINEANEKGRSMAKAMGLPFLMVKKVGLK